MTDDPSQPGGAGASGLISKLLFLCGVGWRGCIRELCAFRLGKDSPIFRIFGGIIRSSVQAKNAKAFDTAQKRALYGIEWGPLYIGK